MTVEKTILRNTSLAGGALLAASILIFLVDPSPALLTAVSSFFPLVLSLVGVVLAFGLYRRQTPNREGALVWAAMGLGLLCWAFGELAWFLYAVAENVEAPFPSIADLLWLIGYIPLFFAIAAPYVRLRASIPVRGRRFLAAVLMTMGILLIGVVIYPILSSPEAGTPVEIAVTIAYPVADLFLLSIAIALVMVFLGGQVALSWGLIAGGILLFAVSDLLFSYGGWYGLYYPGGQLNFLSGAFDTLYLAAYLVLDIGLFLRFQLPEPGRDLDLQDFVPEQGKGFLLLADQEGRVIFIDPALHSILGLKNADEEVGKDFGPLFGLPAAFSKAALRKAARTGISDDYTVSLGLSRSKYRLRVVGSNDPQTFTGFDILVHPDRPHSAPLADREAIILGRVANRARESSRNAPGGEASRRIYFDTLVELLFILVSRASGAVVGTAYESVLNEKARRIGCGFSMKKGRAVWDDDRAEPGQYRVLLEEAVRYAGQVVSTATIEQKISEIEHIMDPESVRAAEELRAPPASGRKADTG
jgi:hypothetical protein